MQKFLNKIPVIPILNTPSLQDAELAASALIEGGCKAIEIVLRTPNSLSILEHLVKKFTNTSIGAGTITSVDLFKQAYDKGAEFFVSPGIDDSVIALVKELDVHYLPGAATPSEIMYLQNLGFNTLKIFPVNFLGGAPYIRQISSVFPLLSFCPTGGIALNNIKEYAQLHNVISVGSSWPTAEEVVNKKEFRQISERYLKLSDSFIK